MSDIRIGVVGAGHLGRIHARLIHAMDEAVLAAVVDPSLAAREQLAQEYQVGSFADYRQLIGKVDAAVVAAPTRAHHDVGLGLLQNGIHVLIEKPLAVSTVEADALIQAAEDRNLVLQVGHVERFNPALRAAAPYLHEPKYIEATRTSDYTFRSADVGVVLDLMIHDLDIILSLVGAQVARVQALGISVLGGHEDMAHARLDFVNGCVANLSASRTSFLSQRKMQIFCAESYAQLDFARHTATLIRPHERLLRRTIHVDDLPATEKVQFRKDLFRQWLPIEQLPVNRCNPLADELEDFCRGIRTGQRPQVDGSQGRDALDVAERILEQIGNHYWSDDMAGPLAAPLPHVLPTPQPIAPVPAAAPDRRKAG